MANRLCYDVDKELVAMTKEIAIPEFIGESDDALVLVLPTLKDELSGLLEKYYAGETLNYSFGWELVNIANDEYLIVLDIDWEDGSSAVIGFTSEMWEIFRHASSRQNLILMLDWELIMKGIAGGIDHHGDFKPQAILIRGVNRGLLNLLEQAEELDPIEKQSEDLEYLFDVLREIQKEKYLLH